MKKAILTLSIIGALFIGSCNKSHDITLVQQNPASPPAGPSFASQFFASQSVPAQAFTINASMWQMITGVKGTRVTFPPNCFVDQNNNPVTGSVDIELREIYSKGDMIRTGIPSVSGGLPLISGGEIKLVARQGSQELKLAGNNLVQVEMPAGLNPSFQMSEFYADNISGSEDWDQADTTTITVVPDSFNQGNYYYFAIDSMNWINCDYFMSSTGPQTNVKATVSSAYCDTNCMVFISFNGQNSAAHCFSYDANLREFSPGAYYMLPVGMSITIVAIAKINGQYYSDFRSTTVTNNHNETLNLQPTTLAQIEAALDNLP